MPAPLAVILDFNGTLSDDEPLLDRLFREVLAGEGIELTPETYFGELAGFSDPEIVVRALALAGVAPEPDRCAAILRRKIDRYKEVVAHESTIAESAARFAMTVAAEVPIAIASGAVREEIAFVLEGSGLSDLFDAIVGIDDVDAGKPDPESYELALERINRARGLQIRPGDVIAVEDSAAGIEAAHAAGMGCAAVGDDERALRAADFALGRLDGAAAERLLRG